MAKRLFHHLLSLMGSQMLNLAGQLLLVPLFLARWSPIHFGEWLVLSSAATYLGTLDLGMNSAVSNRMLAAYTRKDMEEYTRCQHSATAFYVCLALSVSLLMGLAAWMLPVAHVLKLVETSQREAAEVVWLLSLQVLWMMPVGLFGNTFRTIGQPAKTQWINNAKTFLSFGSTALVLTLGGGMRAVALWQFAPMTLMILFVWYELRRQNPRLVPGLSHARWEVARGLVKPSLLFALILAATALATQGSVVVVSTTLGVGAVAMFVNTRTLCNSVMQVVRTVNNAAWPDVTILYTQGQTERLRAMHRLLISISTCLCIAVAAALWFTGPQVVSLWTHGKIKPDLTFVRWLLVYLVMQSPWLASSTFMIAINKHRDVSRAYLISSILGLAVAAILVRRVGLSGVPMGLIVGEGIACYYFVVNSSCKILEERTAAFLGRIWLGLGTVGAMALGAGWLAERAARGPDMAQWLEIGAATSLTALFVTWILWLTPRERDFLARKVGLSRPA